jgi:hypothetical protein
MQVSTETKKPLFVGEFGSAIGFFGLETAAEVKRDFETKLQAMVDNRVPLAAVWQVSSSTGYADDPLVISRANGLGWMLDEIEAANVEIAAQLDSEQRVADLLPKFEQAIEKASADDVRDLQTMLIDRGFTPGAPDGRYGPGTRKALTACVASGTCTAVDLPPAQ